MEFNLAVSVFRHWNLNEIINYIAENGLKLINFELRGDWITIEVSGSNHMDYGLFEEFIGDIEYIFDKENELA